VRARLVRLGLILAGIAAVAFVIAVALRPRPDRPAGHAYPIPSATDRITVEVLNASGRTGIARVGARQLRRHGLDVVFFGNADASSPAESTRIIARRGSLKAAETVAGALGQGRVGSEMDTLRRVDVTVLLGKDFQPEPGLHP
jgi:hypothetical protein